MSRTPLPKIIIVGKGAFGTLMARHLRPHARIQFVEEGEEADTIARKLTNAYAIIYAVPVASLTDAIKATKAFVQPQTLVLDVTSVKVEPLKLLARHFPEHQVLGTHPIFGPQSVRRNGRSLKGLTLVLCNHSCLPKTMTKIRRFAKQELGCRVIEQSAAEHDHQMAHVQGLAHFIGRALKHLDIQDYPTSTESYHQLVELRDLLVGDSWELFETIQKSNPEARGVRRRFVHELKQLEKRLK